MTYISYCKINSEEELLLDNLRVQKNRNELVKDIFATKELSYAFSLGVAFVILFGTIPAWADDLKPTQEAKKDFLRRLSNTVACGAITAACGKAAQAGPKAVEIAAN